MAANIRAESGRQDAQQALCFLTHRHTADNQHRDKAGRTKGGGADRLMLVSHVHSLIKIKA